MTKTRTLQNSSYDQYVKYFKYALIGSALFVLFCIVWTTASICNSPTINFVFCFSNECLERTIDSYSSSLKIIKSLLLAFTSIATIGGIFFALKNYLHTQKSSILQNHIAHFTLFKDFVLGEISKRDKLHISCFDVFKWYNLIYPQSKQGSMNASTAYMQVISDINSAIESSNEQVSKASNGSFFYKKHQHKLINVMLPLGIELGTLPRNNFYEVETQLVTLLKVVNDEFCGDEAIPQLTKRNYI